MILVHIIVGMATGLISATILWLFGLPLWLILMSYSLMGAFGLLMSAFVGYFWTSRADRGRNIPSGEFELVAGYHKTRGPTVVACEHHNLRLRTSKMHLANSGLQRGRHYVGR